MKSGRKKTGLSINTGSSPKQENRAEVREVQLNLDSDSQETRAENYNIAINQLRGYINNSLRDDGFINLRINIKDHEILCSFRLSDIYMLKFSIDNEQIYQLEEHTYGETKKFKLVQILRIIAEKGSLSQDDQNQFCDVCGNVFAEAIRFTPVQEYVARKIAKSQDINLDDQLELDQRPLFIVSNDKPLTIKELRSNWKKLSEQKRNGQTTPNIEDGKFFYYGHSDLLAVANSPSVRESGKNEKKKLRKILSPFDNGMFRVYSLSLKDQRSIHSNPSEEISPSSSSSDITSLSSITPFSDKTSPSSSSSDITPFSDKSSPNSDNFSINLFSKNSYPDNDIPILEELIKPGLSRSPKIIDSVKKPKSSLTVDFGQVDNRANSSKLSRSEEFIVSDKNSSFRNSKLSRSEELSIENTSFASANPSVHKEGGFTKFIKRSGNEVQGRGNT